MKILFVNTGSYINMDMMNATADIFGRDVPDELGYFFGEENIFQNIKFEEVFTNRLNSVKYDYIISTNFYPVIARICHDKRIIYISWSYDTPMSAAPCEEMKYDTNYIFTFDRIEANKYSNLGYERVYHLPLAVNTKRYDSFAESSKYKADVSFMGKIYRTQLYKIKKGINNELIEYVNKLITIQHQTLGRYIIDDFISDSIINEFSRQYDESGRNLHISQKELAFVIAEHVTYLDRLLLLKLMSQKFDTHLYTFDIDENEKQILKDVHLHNSINYFKEMPCMFKSSKINLSGSHRAAKSAIPLRALDIMGCCAFLLTPPQPELVESFRDGKEIAVFYSYEEAVDKASYFLNHEKERKAIAIRGYERIKNEYRYDYRIKKMFRTTGMKL